jgi:DNA polymerase/3'-5' exonuclease PolX
MRHAEALRIAERIRDELLPECERIEIAGSIRRDKPEVKDIELVAVPKTRTIQDMLGYEVLISALERYQWSLLGTLAKNGPRYKKILTYEGITLDLFIVLPPAQFGVIYTIRTGPAEFSQWCVTPRRQGGGLPSDSKVSDGRVLRYGEPIPMAEEIDFLRYVGFADGISPEKREANWREK